jgi:hypothetical protein
LNVTTAIPLGVETSVIMISGSGSVILRLLRDNY